MWTRGCRWKGRLVREAVQAQGWAPLVVGHQLEQAAALPLAQNLKSLPSLQSWYHTPLAISFTRFVSLTQPAELVLLQALLLKQDLTNRIRRQV